MNFMQKVKMCFIKLFKEIVDSYVILSCNFFAAFSLEGSGISFADLFRLIAFYCISR